MVADDDVGGSPVAREPVRRCPGDGALYRHVGNVHAATSAPEMIASVFDPFRSGTVTRDPV